MAYSKTTWVNGSAPAISADNLNNIENGIEAVHVDYVTAHGTSNGWYYKKYSNGTCELWCADEQTVSAISTSSVGAYTTASALTLTLPFTVNNAIVTCTNANALSIASVTVAGTTISYKPYRWSTYNQSLTTTTYIHVFGTY